MNAKKKKAPEKPTEQAKKISFDDMMRKVIQMKPMPTKKKKQ